MALRHDLRTARHNRDPRRLTRRARLAHHLRHVQNLAHGAMVVSIGEQPSWMKPQQAPQMKNLLVRQPRAAPPTTPTCARDF